MKRSLRLLLAFSPLSVFAQAPIAEFYPTGSQTAYNVVTTMVPFDESVSGENLEWSLLDQLVPIAESVSEVRSATAEEISQYPLSTTVLETTTVAGGNTGSGRILWTSTGGAISITGIATDAFTLNYSSNNGTLGTFPLTYGYQNTDAVSGTFDGMGYAGTFSGNMLTQVDAHGTLQVNIAGTPQTLPVTRLKTTQNLSLTYIIPNVGTVIQTIYNYYSPDFSTAVMRSTRTQISVPMLSIDEVTESLEVFAADLLSTPSTRTDEIVAYPNPASDRIFINGTQVSEVRIFDVLGREQVRTTDVTSGIDVGGLQTGVYLMQIKSGDAGLVKRFVKR